MPGAALVRYRPGADDVTSGVHVIERSRPAWLALPVAVLVLAGASSPWVTQRTPPWLFPVMAVLGGALVLWSFARSVARLVRGYRDVGRLRILPVIVNALATLLFVVLPLARLVGLVAAAPGGPPRILAGFGDWLGGEGYPRLSAHRGIDVAARPGADVLAAADGRVTVARDNGDLCGLIVAIAHDPYGYRTIYCHSSALAVKPGDTIARGQRIGAAGTTGQRAWPGYEHVHLELQRGNDVNAIEDPRPRIAGCFDPSARYPSDRLVLTYPVKC
jgi:murein DD-endopeptidase MepM/ murein hydrolase activator NlpD